MASVNSPLRKVIKPFLFKLLGKKGYTYAQFFGKMRDIKYKLVEEKEMELLSEFVKEGDNVIDIGANYAYYTDRLSGLVGKEGRVFSFEPILFTFKVCSMIVRAKKMKNVTLYNLGVSNKDQQISFCIPKLTYGAISAGQAHIAGRINAVDEKHKYYNFDQEEKVECRVVALDTFLPAIEQPISFIKIDIEGAEYFALQGMEKLIQKHRSVLLIEIQPYFLSGFDINENIFRDYITGTMGYRIFFYEEKKRKLSELTTAFFDSNFILLPAEKIQMFTKIISDD